MMEKYMMKQEVKRGLWLLPCMLLLMAGAVCAADLADVVFISRNNDNVRRMTAAGDEVWLTVTTGQDHYGMTIGPDGNVYICCNQDENVRVFNGETGVEEATPVAQWPTDANYQDVVFSSNGDMYVATENTAASVLVFTKASGYTSGSVFASTGITGALHGLDFGPDSTGDGVSDLYVVQDRNSSTVHIVNGVTGAVASSWSTTGLAYSDDLVVGSDGRVYICAANTNNVMSFNLDGSGALEVATAETPRCLCEAEPGIWYIGEKNGDGVHAYADNWATYTGLLFDPGTNAEFTGVASFSGDAVATNPDPEDGEDVLAAETTTLSWTNAEDTDACDVYFASDDVARDENGDPNRDRMEQLFFKPPVTSVSIDDFASYSTPLDEGMYVWIVDCNTPIGAPAPDNFWTFNIVANIKPVVDAGDSIVTWLAAAQAGITLDGTVTDENGEEDIASIEWKVIDPAYPGMDWDVTFDDETDPDTTVTIAEAEPREYVLVLTAIDKDEPPHEVSDAILITVYADACEAAMNNPLEDYTPLEFDFDGNCQEDLFDFAVLAAKWLEYNYLTENILFDAGTIIAESDVLLWLDASDAATITKSTQGSYEKVSKWNDKSGNNYYMEQTDVEHEPNYVASDSDFGGLPAINFAEYYHDNANPPSGDWMQLKDAQGEDVRLTTIRTVFVVMQGPGHVLADNSSHDFHRDRDREGDPNNNIWDGGGWASANVTDGQTYLNGVLVDGTETEMPVEGAVISVITTDNVNCDTLAKDRFIRSGGPKYGEIIIFNRALRDEERELVEGDLKAKWGF